MTSDLDISECQTKWNILKTHDIGCKIKCRHPNKKRALSPVTLIWSRYYKGKCSSSIDQVRSGTLNDLRWLAWEFWMKLYVSIAQVRSGGLNDLRWVAWVMSSVGKLNAVILTYIQRALSPVTFIWYRYHEGKGSLTNHWPGTQWSPQWSALGWLREERTLAR